MRAGDIWADASGATLPVRRDALPQLCPDDVPILGPWRGKEPSQGRATQPADGPRRM